MLNNIKFSSSYNIPFKPLNSIVHKDINGAYTEYIKDNMYTEWLYIKDDIKDFIYMKVLFHELAHATGSIKRLNRNCSLLQRASGDTEKYIIEELIAERTAQKLMEYFKLYEIHTYVKSICYINAYINHLNELNNQIDFDIYYQIEFESDLAMNYILNNFITKD